MARAFVIRPFNQKQDSAGTPFNFEDVHSELIGPALDAAQLVGSTTGEIIEAGNIREDMFSLILEADLVICDVTLHNANVFYELGIRHALRKKCTILIREKSSADRIPFDLLTDRYLAYDLGNLEASKEQLTEMIRATLRSDQESDSPIFKMLPSLKEADPSSVQVVPLDFREEVERAHDATSKGWLRLLAQEVRGLRFQWIALQLIAKAQWEVKDYEGAKESLEAIRETHRDNVDANLSLANIYERLSRRPESPDLLTASDQAIERVLISDNVQPDHYVEALTLKGRNQKTRWRWKFKSLSTVEERRRAAMNEALRKSHDAYRDAFYKDLNHFYSGLATLQMGHIFLDLSAGEDPSWKDSFDDDEEAEAYRRKLSEEVEALQQLVPTSVEAGLRRMPPTDSERVWAEISKVDVLFLTADREQRIIRRYKDVIPRDNPFAWDAAKGQLKLFATLGIKAELARKVIAAVDQHVETPPATSEKPVHVILFAGHRVDLPDRAEPRFPPEQEDRARALIRDELRQLKKDYQLHALASAAPGGDILFHEVCDELGIPSTLCLPIPASDYARVAFENLDGWRSRFLDLQHTCDVLELSDREGLPRWLEGTDTNAWERGNRWVLQMALTSDAKRVTLVALWDGENAGDAPGGTAHMVELARDAGTVHVKVINAKRLVNASPLP